MASIYHALARVKQDLSRHLPESTIEQAANDAGHKWRDRILGPVITVQLFVLQVLHLNTSMTHVRHLAGRQFKPSAYCQARQRLPLKLMQTLLRKMCDAANATGRFHGYKLWIADGSSASLPDTPALQKVFPQTKRQRQGCGFPLIKLLGIFDAATGMFFAMLPASLHTHEHSQIAGLHPLLGKGDVLLGDRGLCSFWHLAMLQARGIYAVFRIHQRQIVDFRPHRKHRKSNAEKGVPTSQWIEHLGRLDQIVQWIKPKNRPVWMSVELYKQLPQTLLVREVRYLIPRKGQRTRCVTIATTLLDPKRYPKSEIRWLYQTRWEVETHFRELKTTMRMRVLKCKTVDGVKKELLAFALAYNLVRLAMVEASMTQNVNIDRISFIDTLRWLITAMPGDALPDLVVNPLRDDRHEPRAIKRRAKQYDLMNKPREELRKRLRKTTGKVAVLN